MSNTYPTGNAGTRYAEGNFYSGQPALFSKLVVFASSIITDRVETSASTYTITSTVNDYIIMADTSSNAIAITLPNISGEPV